MSCIDLSRVRAWLCIAKDQGDWFSSVAFDRTVRLGRVSVRLFMRRSDGIMGRFGGGWNWKIGIQWGKTTCIMSLLVMEVIVTRHRKEVPK